MNQLIKNIFLNLLCLVFAASMQAQSKLNLQEIFQHPPESAKPWTLWYWMHGVISKAGLTADLEAMKEIGLGGAYIVNIQDTTAAIPFKPTARQLTPEWWEMIRFAMQEAKRLNLKLGLHVSDGFALAGGPWITPELSMQKLVWSSVHVSGGNSISMALPRPESYKNYYKDVAIYAYPAPIAYGVSSATISPKVTTSLPNVNASFLATDTAKKSFSSGDSCWIQYEFIQPFTCRSIVIRKPGTSFQSQRLLVQVSNDGINFKDWERLEPARHGWQDGDADNTYSIQPVTAKYFRFVYGKSGTEPGSEDLDAAKWKPSLKINGIVLLSEVRLHQYEAKNASVWRIAAATAKEAVADSFCIPQKKLLNITQYLQPDGTLNWQAPADDWVILRMGYTSTGHENATGGGGKGLECDKFNPVAIKLQFNNWFGSAFAKNPVLAKEVLKVFYIDSWEAGSQNWSPLFREEFKKRRGYDPLPWLPCMAGIPVESAAASEKFLHDIRETIAELVNDVFYKTLAQLSKEKGCLFTAESVAPTMMSDGLLHYGTVDIPMGEFWNASPTHDKPNDMLDAVSGAHIYGKNIVAAEAFTTVRMAWNEHPGMLKTVQDRNYALGVNRLVYHVFAHNPGDRKPGVTLDGVGLYFQRDQTWWKQGKAWIDYATRCQALLQLGKPVTDIAVFTGEEVPRRSILPDRLVPVLPGLFGKDRVEAEAKRLANMGEPLQNIPDGVSSAANMYKAEDWIDPLNGYQYDCLNPDVLKKAVVVKGRIMLPSGANYGVLVLPGKTKMAPNGDTLSAAMQRIVQRLIDAGAKVIAPPGMRLKENSKMGGKVLVAPYQKEDLKEIGLEKDLVVKDDSGKTAGQVAWTHRKGNGFDIYFLSNQKAEGCSVNIFLKVESRLPEYYNPVTSQTFIVKDWDFEDGYTALSIDLQPNESAFVILQKQAVLEHSNKRRLYNANRNRILVEDWTVHFNTDHDGLTQPIPFPQLGDWSQSSDSSIRYYSGTATYTKIIQVNPKVKTAVLDLGEVANIATVKVNGIDCGTVWTPPFTVDITKAIKPGENKIEIAVTNTWHNALIGDHLLPENQRKYWTTAPFRLEGKPLDKAGLLGPVRLVLEQ